MWILGLKGLTLVECYRMRVDGSQGSHEMQDRIVITNRLSWQYSSAKVCKE